MLVAEPAVAAAPTAVATPPLAMWTTAAAGCPTTHHASSAPVEAATDVEMPLLHLPQDVLRSVLARLQPADRAALRASGRGGRAIVNGRVSGLSLSESDLATAARLPLPDLFPDLVEVRMTLDGSTAPPFDIGSPPKGSPPTSSTLRPPPPPPAQLPGRFAGSCTIRTGGSGVVGGSGSPGGGASGGWGGRLGGGEAEARAAEVLSRCAPRALRLSVFAGGTGGAPATDVAALLEPPAAARRLRRLWVRAPQIQEPALLAIGRLRALEDLALASSGGITTCHLTDLGSLTALRMTVAAPLAPALAPLAALTRLRALHLRCISPCGSWGAALAPALRAAAGTLVQLRLNFATLSEDDVAGFKLAPGLQVLDLSSCRQLSAAAVGHIASLTALTSLRLEHTGLILAHPQLRLLGACRRLSELSVDSLDLCIHRQEEERARALLAAAAAAANGAESESSEGAGGGAGGLLAPTGWPPLVRVHLHSTSSFLNLESLLRNADGLRHLTLLHYVRWDEAANLIASCGTGLESLHISGCSGMTADGFMRLASMPHLTRLVFRNAWLSASRILPLAPLPAAGAGAAGSVVQVYGPSGGDAAMIAAAAPGSRWWQGQTIRSLQLEHCTGLDAATAAVIARMPWLTRLTARDCPDLGEPALLALAAAPRLARLEVSHCQRVCPAARGVVRRERERLVSDLAAVRLGDARQAAAAGDDGVSNDRTGGGSYEDTAMEVDVSVGGDAMATEDASCFGFGGSDSDGMVVDAPAGADGKEEVAAAAAAAVAPGGLPEWLWPLAPDGIDVLFGSSDEEW